MNSHNFLLATLTQQATALIAERTAHPPIPLIPEPIVFLSQPIDRDEFASGLSDDTVEVEVTGHGFFRNPTNNRDEFSLLVTPVIPTLLSDLGVDNLRFSPYVTLAYWPMTSRIIRRWCGAVGDSLFGLRMQVVLQFSDNQELPALYNPVMESIGDVDASRAL